MRKGPHNFPSPPSLHSLLCHLCFSYSCSCKSLSTAAQLVSPPPPLLPLATPLAEACSIWRALATAFTLFASHLPQVVAVAAGCCCFSDVVVVAFTFAVAVAVGGPLGCQRYALLFAQHTKGQRNKQAKAAANGGGTWKGGAERATLFSSECV